MSSSRSKDDRTQLSFSRCFPPNTSFQHLNEMFDNTEKRCIVPQYPVDRVSVLPPILHLG